MTEKQREIFYRLLVDLFVDNPKRKRPQAQEGKNTDENIPPKESGRTRELDIDQAATDE